MTDPEIELTVQKNEFLSECFKRDIYILDIFENTANAVDYTQSCIQLCEMLTSLAEYPYLICKQDLRSLPVIHGLESNRFRLMSVDTKLKLAASNKQQLNSNLNRDISVKLFGQEDQPHLSDLFIRNEVFYRDTHFYNTPFLKNDDCDALYKKWIQRNLAGRTNENYIAVFDDQIVGFTLCSKQKDQLDIDLIWVDETKRNRGLASLMIQNIISENENLEITVSTQVTNYAALSLYIKLGFKSVATYGAFHKCLDAGNCAINSGGDE